MEAEIKKPVIDRPDFPKVPYDYRNMEKAGHYKGVGEAGKTGNFTNPFDPHAMPKESNVMRVPRDHEG